MFWDRFCSTVVTPVFGDPTEKKHSDWDLHALGDVCMKFGVTNTEIRSIGRFPKGSGYPEPFFLNIPGRGYANENLVNPSTHDRALLFLKRNMVLDN
jgi:hypothetical protein